MAGVVGDGPHPGGGEHLGEGAFHHRAVLQHVGDPGRAAHVVFQYVELPVPVAHEVGAGNVAPDPLRWVDARALGAVAGGRLHNVPRDHAVAQDLAVVVDVVNEQIQGSNPLLQPALQYLPVRRTDDARHQVKGKDLFRALVRPIHVERHPRPQEGLFGGALASQQFL